MTAWKDWWRKYLNMAIQRWKCSCGKSMTETEVAAMPDDMDADVREWCLEGMAGRGYDAEDYHSTVGWALLWLAGIHLEDAETDGESGHRVWLYPGRIQDPRGLSQLTHSEDACPEIDCRDPAQVDLMEAYLSDRLLSVVLTWPVHGGLP